MARCWSTARRIGVGQQRAGELGGDLEILRRARVVVGQPPQQRRRADEHRQHDEDGEVELEIEALHAQDPPVRRGHLIRSIDGDSSLLRLVTGR